MTDSISSWETNSSKLILNSILLTSIDLYLTHSWSHGQLKDKINPVHYKPFDFSRWQEVKNNVGKKEEVKEWYKGILNHMDDLLLFGDSFCIESKRLSPNTDLKGDPE